MRIETVFAATSAKDPMAMFASYEVTAYFKRKEDAERYGSRSGVMGTPAPVNERHVTVADNGVTYLLPDGEQIIVHESFEAAQPFGKLSSEEKLRVGECLLEMAQQSIEGQKRRMRDTSSGSQE